MNHNEDFSGVLRDYFTNGTLQTYPKNSVIVTDSEHQKMVYFIKSGYVRVHSNNGRGEEYTHILYGAGEIFPLMWLAKQQRNVSAYQALTEAEIHAVPVATVDSDLTKQAQLAYAMLRQAVEQYRIYALRVANLEYKYASERLAYRLILLANRFGIRDGNETTIEPPMTHQMLATSLNLSRESVSREIEKLIRRGLIRYNPKRQIVLADMQELATQLHVPMQQGIGEAT